MEIMPFMIFITIMVIFHDDSSKVTSLLLDMNDDINNQLLRYERLIQYEIWYECTLRIAEPGMRWTFKKGPISFFSWFLSWSFDVLWFLFDGFTTFHNFCQLLSPFLKCSQLFRYKKNRRRVSQCSGAEGEDEEAVLSTNDVVLELSAGHLLSFHSPYTSWFLKGLITIRDGKTRGRCGRVHAIFFLGCANFLASYTQTS